jgi:hypothetical protein
MDSRGLQRFAPLSGVVFVAMLVVAVIIGGETPDNDDSLASIANFWRENDSDQIWSSAIGAWSTVFFLWFAASLRNTLRRSEGDEPRLSSLSFAGAVIGAGGLLAAFSISFAAADGADDLSAVALKTLTVLSNGFFFPIGAGFAVFFIAAGVLAVRTAALPVWLGWITVVLGIACLTPAGFFAFLVGAIWILIVSVMIYRMEAGPAKRPEPTPPEAPATA